MRKYAVLFAVTVIGTLAYAQSCGRSGDLVGTSETVATTTQTQQSQSTVTTPQPTAPTPADQSAPAPYTELSNVDGSGKVCNPMSHVVTFRVERYDINGSPTSLAGQILLDTELITVQPGQCAPVKGVGFLASEIKCGTVINIQVDVAVLDGRHLGAAIVKNFEAEPCCEEEATTEVTYEYGEWSECAPVVQESHGSPEPKCSRSRTVTTIYTTTYKCSKEIEVRRETGTESEPCECPCVGTTATSQLAGGLYCLDSPLGSETSEALGFKISYHSFVKLDGNDEGCMTVGSHDIMLFKDGTGGPCPHGKHAYYLYVNEPAGKYCPFKYWDWFYWKYKDISHVTFFDGKECK